MTRPSYPPNGSKGQRPLLGVSISKKGSTKQILTCTGAQGRFWRKTVGVERRSRVPPIAAIPVAAPNNQPAHANRQSRKRHPEPSGRCREHRDTQGYARVAEGVVL